MCLSILTIVLTLGLARTARDPDGDDWALEVDPRGRARVHSPSAHTSTSSLHWSEPQGWEPKSRGEGSLTHTGGDQPKGVHVQDEAAGAEAAAPAPACTVTVNSERKGARSFGVLACDGSGNPGASCMKSMLRDGTLTMGCDKFLCTEVGNPTSCCTLPGTARRIVCSSADFETEVSERDFEDCSRPCVERSITCTVNISGTVHTKETCRTSDFLMSTECMKAQAGTEIESGCDKGYCTDYFSPRGCCKMESRDEKLICQATDSRLAEHDFENCIDHCIPISAAALYS